MPRSTRLRAPIGVGLGAYRLWGPNPQPLVGEPFADEEERQAALAFQRTNRGLDLATRLQQARQNIYELTKNRLGEPREPRVVRYPAAEREMQRQIPPQTRFPKPASLGEATEAGTAFWELERKLRDAWRRGEIEPSQAGPLERPYLAERWWQAAEERAGRLGASRGRRQSIAEAEWLARKARLGLLPPSAALWYRYSPGSVFAQTAAAAGQTPEQLEWTRMGAALPTAAVGPALAALALRERARLEDLARERSEKQRAEEAAGKREQAAREAAATIRLEGHRAGLPPRTVEEMAAAVGGKAPPAFDPAIYDQEGRFRSPEEATRRMVERGDDDATIIRTLTERLGLSRLEAQQRLRNAKEPPKGIGQRVSEALGRYVYPGVTRPPKGWEGWGYTGY